MSGISYTYFFKYIYLTFYAFWSRIREVEVVVLIE